MQKLEVVARLFPRILSGEKTSSIRWRELQIMPGRMAYVNEDDPNQTVVVCVTKCTDMPLSDVATYLGRESEWPDQIMLEGMQEHYPEIKLNSIIQLIEHLTPEQTQECERSD
ncbi:MAG: ASCH domain-containing protein [Halopseudomonas aestusnigri]